MTKSYFSRLFRRRRRPFELRADGALVGTFRTYSEAQQAASVAFVTCNRYAIDERIAGRLFNRAFGYRPGTTSTADLAAMGVPIHPDHINDRR